MTANIKRFPSRWIVNPEYPLTKLLSGVVPNDVRRSTPSKNEKAPDTVDIVNPELGPDIIKYIAPSLEEYKGCDIIDLHPGTCLWSQPLHDFLKPRCHLLMEPEERYYKPFIQPLLEKPNSAYRYTTIPGAHPKSYWEVYKGIFDGHLLPKRDPFPPGDPRLRQHNRSLLVTGSLSRRYKDWRTHNNNVHTASLILGQMAQASQINSLFHAYGLVRMLLWMPEDTKPQVLPDTILSRHAFSATLDTATSIVEVAGLDRQVLTPGVTDKKKYMHKHRRNEMDLLGATSVLDKMQRQGLSLPPHRRSTIHQQALDHKSSQHSTDLDKFNYIKPPSGSNLDEKMTAHECDIQDKFAMLDKSGRWIRRKGDLGMPYKFEFTSASKQVLNQAECSRAGPCLDLWCSQVALEMELGKTKDTLSDAARKDIEARLRVSKGKMKEIWKSIGNNHVFDVLHSVVDEVAAFGGVEPVLAWDRRPYEPLTVTDDEFWPRFGMYLVDVQPKLENMADDLMTPNEANAAQRELLSGLFSSHASSVVHGLNKVGSNGAEDLIPAVPDLQDGSKGGRLDPEDLNVRLLTMGQIEGLTRAYIEWPFRPSAGDLLQEEV